MSKSIATRLLNPSTYPIRPPPGNNSFVIVPTTHFLSSLAGIEIMDELTTNININRDHLPSFPLELYDLVFTFLASDHDWSTLKICTLLSHLHLRRARAILFASVTFQLRHTQTPNPILIHDVIRRIHGLTDLFRRDPSTALAVKRFTILDSYPVYDSQWITQLPALPHLITHLTGVRNCTFGCSVGYLQWTLFTPPLQLALSTLFSSPNLESLTLCNIGSVPTAISFNVGNRMKYIGLNHVNMQGITMDYPPVLPLADSRVMVMNIRTLSLQNTNAAWAVIQAHANGLKVIRWRCWEDPLARDGVCFPGRINLSLLPSLHTFTLRISYAKTGRDLAGFCSLLESLTNPLTPSPTSLVILSLAILFPLHQPAYWDSDRTGMGMREVYRSPSWGRLARALGRREVFGALRRVRMELTVHEARGRWNSGAGIGPFVGVGIGGMGVPPGTSTIAGFIGGGGGGGGQAQGRRSRMQNSLVVFREQMKSILRPLSDNPNVHFTCRVRAFDQRSMEELA